ncbi:MAG: tRNA (adenosine(37)-N6)-threonylcarbamoyltransferase complex transferase subunit TsaD [Spirochaetales bacterium]|nr:tRNA (adenosine(37)-N6)-threonylcarbamoyltransferase complex transferase subunit TsaD [Spirochaetales bacterium]
MIVLGIETSCDECSASLVEDGKNVLSNRISTQIEFHKPYYGVVPEIASRKHLEWIYPVVEAALKDADIELKDIDGIAVTYRPGLIGSLLVGVSFTKGLAYSLGKPLAGVDHIIAHLYAPHLENDIEYPYLGLIISGGHTIIAKVEKFNSFTVLGTTIDDACGEAFDKVAKHYKLGYPGGVAIDKLAKKGDQEAFRFPKPSLHKGRHTYDVSYSGLKTAVINQLDQFWNGVSEKSAENIAASFQKTAIDIVAERVLRAARDMQLKRIVVAGGVAANSYLRRVLNGFKDYEVIFPSLLYCTDNGAMVAGIGYHYFKAGITSPLSLNAEARVPQFRNLYP